MTPDWVVVLAAVVISLLLSSATSSTLMWDTGLMMNWPDAYSFCRASNASLPVIRTAQENDLLAASAHRKLVWTAALRFDLYTGDPYNFLWLLDTGQSLPLFDTTTSTCVGGYCPFVSGIPSMAVSSTPACVAQRARTALWSDVVCSQLSRVVCNVSVCPPGTFEEVILESSSRCTPCPARTFNPFSGQKSASACTPCPDVTTSAPGSATCQRTAYWMVNGRGLRWSDANAFCLSRGGSLPVVFDLEENAALFNATDGKLAWLGGSRSVVDNAFLWSVTQTSYIELFNGTSFDRGSCVQFCHFYPGEPNNRNNNKAYMDVNFWPSQWTDDSGYSDQLTVCTRRGGCPAGSYASGSVPGGTETACASCPANTFNPLVDQVSPTACIPCPAGLSTDPAGGASECRPRYWHSQRDANWTDAWQFCSSRGCSLPAITSVDAQNFVMEVSPTLLWTSGTRLVPYSSSSTVFEWVPGVAGEPSVPFFNGTTMGVNGHCLPGQYCNFNFREPNNLGGGEKCIQEDDGTGLLSDNNCAVAAATVCACTSGCPPGSYLPEIGNVYCTTCPGNTFNPLNNQTGASACRPCAAGLSAPPGSTSCTPNYYWWPSLINMTWSDANDFCTSHGAALPSIFSDEDSTALLAFLQTRTNISGSIWLSAKLSDFNLYEWLVEPNEHVLFYLSKSKKFGFVNWGPSQPAKGSDGNVLGCASLDRTPVAGKWSARDCSKAMLATVCVVHASCPPGTFPRETACVSCPRGTYNPRSHNVSGNATELVCLPCAQGFYSVTAASSCTPCEAGNIAPELDSSYCSACPNPRWYECRTPCDASALANAPPSGNLTYRNCFVVNSSAWAVSPLVVSPLVTSITFDHVVVLQSVALSFLPLVGNKELEIRLMGVDIRDTLAFTLFDNASGVRAEIIGSVLHATSLWRSDTFYNLTLVLQDTTFHGAVGLCVVHATSPAPTSSTANVTVLARNITHLVTPVSSTVATASFLPAQAIFLFVGGFTKMGKILVLIEDASIHHVIDGSVGPITYSFVVQLSALEVLAGPTVLHIRRSKITSSTTARFVNQLSPSLTNSTIYTSAVFRVSTLNVGDCDEAIIDSNVSMRLTGSDDRTTFTTLVFTFLSVPDCYLCLVYDGLISLALVNSVITLDASDFTAVMQFSLGASTATTGVFATVVDSSVQLEVSGNMNPIQLASMGEISQKNSSGGLTTTRTAAVVSLQEMKYLNFINATFLRSTIRGSVWVDYDSPAQDVAGNPFSSMLMGASIGLVVVVNTTLVDLVLDSCVVQLEILQRRETYTFFALWGSVGLVAVSGQEPAIRVSLTVVNTEVRMKCTLNPVPLTGTAKFLLTQLFSLPLLQWLMVPNLRGYGAVALPFSIAVIGLTCCTEAFLVTIANTTVVVEQPDSLGQALEDVGGGQTISLFTGTSATHQLASMGLPQPMINAFASATNLPGTFTWTNVNITIANVVVDMTNAPSALFLPPAVASVKNDALRRYFAAAMILQSTSTDGLVITISNTSVVHSPHATAVTVNRCGTHSRPLTVVALIDSAHRCMNLSFVHSQYVNLPLAFSLLQQWNATLVNPGINVSRVTLSGLGAFCVAAQRAQEGNWSLVRQSSSSSNATGGAWLLHHVDVSLHSDSLSRLQPRLLPAPFYTWTITTAVTLACVTWNGDDATASQLNVPSALLRRLPKSAGPDCVPPDVIDRRAAVPPGVSVVTIVAAIAMSGSPLAGSPIGGIPGSVQRSLSALILAQACDSGTVPTLDETTAPGYATTDNPLQVALPLDAERVASWSGGAVVGNTLLCALIFPLVALVVCHVQQRAQSAKGVAVPFSELLRSATMRSGLPASAAAIYGFLLQPTVLSSLCLVLLNTRTVGSTVLGCVGFVLSVAPLLYTVVLMRKKTTLFRSARRTGGRHARGMRDHIDRWFEDDTAWKVALNSPAWARRWLSVVSGYRQDFEWFLFVDVGQGILAAGVVAFGLFSTTEGCFGSQWLLLLLSVAVLVLQVWARPTQTTFDLACALVSSILAVVTCIAGMVQLDALANAATTTQTILAIVAIATPLIYERFKRPKATSSTHCGPRTSRVSAVQQKRTVSTSEALKQIVEMICARAPSAHNRQHHGHGSATSPGQQKTRNPVKGSLYKDDKRST